MVDQIITKQKLINADKDADRLDTAVNGSKTQKVTTRWGNQYPTLAGAIQTIIDAGGFAPFSTETALLASVPVVVPSAAKALDTKKVWLWKKTSAENVEPEVFEWQDTGLSEIELAKKEIDSSVSNAVLDAKIPNRFKYQNFGSGFYSYTANIYHWLFGKRLVNDAVDFVQFKIDSTLLDFDKLHVEIYTRDSSNNYDLSNATLIQAKDYLISEIIDFDIFHAGYNHVFEPIIHFPLVTAYAKPIDLVFKIYGSKNGVLQKIGFARTENDSVSPEIERGWFSRQNIVNTTAWQGSSAKLVFRIGLYNKDYLNLIDFKKNLVSESLPQLNDRSWATTTNFVTWSILFRAIPANSFNCISLYLQSMQNVKYLRYAVFARTNVSTLNPFYDATDRQIEFRILDFEKSGIVNTGTSLIDLRFDSSLVTASERIGFVVEAFDKNMKRMPLGVVRSTPTSANELTFVSSPPSLSLDKLSDSVTIAYQLSMLTAKEKLVIKNKELSCAVEINDIQITDLSARICFTSYQMNTCREEIAMLEFDASQSGSATKDITLKNNTAPWVLNENTYFGERNVSNVVVKTSSNVTLNSSQYTVDSLGGKLLVSDASLNNVTATATFDYKRHRYDIIAHDLINGGLKILKGADRSWDPKEWMSDIPMQYRAVAIAHIIGNKLSAIRKIGLTDGIGGAPLIPDADWQFIEKHNKANLKRIFAKLEARRNTAQEIVICGVGDSITYSPDHEFYISQFAPSDTVDKYRIAGSSFFQFGWNYQLKAYFEKEYAVTVRYENIGVAGQDSGFGATADRLFAMTNIKSDLVVLCFGMNDNTTLDYTYGNMVTIIRAAKASGSDVVVVPPPRTTIMSGYLYNPDESWRDLVNRTFRAAIDAGAAVVPIHKYVDRNSQFGIGIADDDFCGQNRYNHPSVYEFNCYSKMLINVFK